MTWRRAALIGAILILTTALAISIVLLREERDRLASLVELRNRLCLTRLSHLKFMSYERVPDPDARMHGVRALTDQYVSSMCLGKPIPIDMNSADWCWIMKHKSECYDDAVRSLIDIYERHSNEWM